MNRNSINNSIKASLLADSLALPVHWIYDQEEIANLKLDLTKLHSPSHNKYHNKKSLGEHTHYGDQAVVLLKSIIKESTFKLESFANDWKDFFRNYAGYYDGATKATISNLESGQAIKLAGSKSSDLGGAARIAGLLSLLPSHSPAQIIEAARAQTAFTHNNSLVIDTAEFLIETSLAVISGAELEVALEQAVSKTMSADFLKLSLEKAKENLHLEPRDAIVKLGQGCTINGALPASLYLILKYSSNLSEALTQNLLSGGDSAARGLVIGMILGATIVSEFNNSELQKVLSLSLSF